MAEAETDTTDLTRALNAVRAEIGKLEGQIQGLMAMQQRLQVLRGTESNLAWLLGKHPAQPAKTPTPKKGNGKLMLWERVRDHFLRDSTPKTPKEIAFALGFQHKAGIEMVRQSLKRRTETFKPMGSGKFGLAL